MTDLDIFGAGCAISFLVLAGSYVYLRHRFSRHEVSEEARRGKAPERARVPIADR